MKKMTPDYLSRVKKAPRFVRAVEKARNEEGSLMESLETFEDDPFLLYSCLWYAYSAGVDVLLKGAGREADATPGPPPTRPRRRNGR